MATENTNAVTEETANTAELHETDAQRVEAPEAEGNIPAEEKTQETAKFEQIDEGEALTLDSIEDLTLPGDMELDSEQPRQRWRITDDGCADWALKKIKAEPNISTSCISPAKQDANTFPNIIAVGLALVISSSIARELFSVATFVATICPYRSITV